MWGSTAGRAGRRQIAQAPNWVRPGAQRLRGRAQSKKTGLGDLREVKCYGSTALVG